MKSMRFFLFVWILLSLITFGCNEDSLSPKPDTPCDIPYVFQQAYHYPLINAPRFNPNNSNEFLYFRYPKEFSEREIRVHNFQTGSDQVIYRGPLFSQADWGVNDWILFNRGDNQIWKMKSNGDSLTQLTFRGINDDARWDKEAKQFIALHANDSTTISAIYDEYGNFLNRQNYLYGDGAWAPNSGILANFGEVGSDFFWVIRFLPNSQEYEKFVLKKKNDSAAFKEHHPTNEDQFFYTTTETYDLKRGNFRTGRSKTIVKGCETNWYQRFSISPFGDKILSDRYNQVVRDSIFPSGEVAQVLHHYQTIWIMDINGKNLRRIELP